MLRSTGDCSTGHWSPAFGPPAFAIGWRANPGRTQHRNEWPFEQGLNERMERFCDELRWERERRKVSIEKICDETKVASRHFVALEAGDYSAMPGGVFRKGIVRSYLAAGGLEEAPWLERFGARPRESGANGTEVIEDWAEFAENVRRNRTGTESKMEMRWVGVGMMLMALAALGWGVWR